MRKHLPFASLFLGTILIGTAAEAQQAQRFAYAVTDIQQGPNWNYLRRIDLQTGAYSDVLLAGNDASFLAYDATSKKQFTAPLMDARYGNIVNAAFATGVAAMAYDKKNDRIYYTPMLIDQLRYIDLKTMKVFYVNDRGFSGQAQKSTDQGNIITRMVIASDGNGYAMTNDGTQLIRFSTNKKMEIVDLGAVADDQANKGISIHNSCSSFGGDMIADDNGNIYVFSARNHVFRINIETKVATHLGMVNGLPSNFTINAAAVNEDNKVIVASATTGGFLYSVDMKSLTATQAHANGTIFQTADMANANLLVTGTQSKGTTNTIEIADLKATANTGDGKVNIYPNPVTDNQFVIRFNGLDAGKYTVNVTDVTGRQVLQQVVAVSGENQAQRIGLTTSTSKGVYLVNVTDLAGKAVYTSKLVVQ